MDAPYLKNRFGLAAKFSIVTIALILVTSVGLSFFASKKDIREKYEALVKNGGTIAEMAAQNCEIGIYTEDRASLFHLVESLSVHPDIVYVSVMNRNHVELAGRAFRDLVSIPDCPFTHGEHLAGTAHLDCEVPGSGYIEIITPVFSVGMGSVADPVMNGGAGTPKPAVIGYLRLGLGKEGIRKHIRETIISTVTITAILILFGSTLTILLTRRIATPLRTLKTATHDIAEGKYDTHIEIRTADEISDLAGSFNHMLERLRAYRDQVEERTSELRESEERYAIAARGANDGLWDWDLRSNTVYFSERWKSMVGCEDREIGSGPEEWFGRIHTEDLERVRREIDAHLDGSTSHFESEYRMRHNDLSFRWMLCRGLAVRENGSAHRMAGSQTDITARKAAEAQLVHDAFHDALTGLPNRVLFLDRLAHVIAIAGRRKDFIFAVLFLDLDRFKVVNDSLGHVVGDQLLIALGRRLLACLRPGDTIARLGGDEFGVLLEDISGVSNATYIAERIQRDLVAPFVVSGHEVFATGSIGIAFNAAGYDRPEQLLRDADTAMYQAKTHRRGGYVVFEPGMHEHAVERLRLETELRRAVERNEFTAYYQPIVSLSTNRLVGFEALARWNHPERGVVGPGGFIQMAEETGMAVSIDRQVLTEACRQMNDWVSRGPAGFLQFVSVNFSNKQMAQPDVVEFVSHTLRETGLPSHHLKIEVTESVIMDNAEAILSMLSRLRDLGVQLYIDDFGTGYSSLSYLHKLPINGFKIDRSFVQRLGEGGENQEIVRTILMLGRDLKVDVVAEGIETPHQLSLLKTLRCDYGQGYLFSKPVNSGEAWDLIAAAEQIENG